ncbi:hypothetical protein FOA52_005669 [Chlamydomonas sp. UWO 241]|nr:hypothetical protein FOA52_005669 [Chlamydomonas sp. UWO 241]
MATRIVLGTARMARLLGGAPAGRSMLFAHAASGRSMGVGSCWTTPLRSGLLPSSRQSQRSSSSSVTMRAVSSSPAAQSQSGMGADTYPFEPEFLPAVALCGDSARMWAGDLLVIAVTEADFAKTGDAMSISSDALKALDADFGGALADIVADGGFEGKKGSSSKAVRVGAAPSAKAKTVAMVGLGDTAKLGASPAWGAGPYQALGAAAAALAKANKASTAAIAFAAAPAGADVAKIATGALISGYESSRFKSKKSPTATKLSALHLLLPGAGDEGAGIAHARAVAAGNMVARYLVEAPPNICTPTHIAACAAHIAAKFPSVMTLEVLEKDACDALGMGSFLGVSEASDEPPKFIHLTYKAPGGGANKKIGLVGKGLTFDSGGYNIKAGPGSMIEMMKFDMGGSAAVLGAARIIAEAQPEGVEVHIIVASCENMIAGKGLRPGDILRSAAGKTIEVNNTDAEGRLTLADALWFAQLVISLTMQAESSDSMLYSEKCGVTSVVDCATLTGACYVALGPDIGGLFSDSDEMADAVTKASKSAGEKVWRMPLEDSYWEGMKSPVADMKNTGSRWGGAITAALFLKQFIKEGVAWAHLDMAGPVWDEKANQATGFGAATLAEWVAKQKQ